MLAKVKIVDMERCIGCELCERVCEFVNGKPRARVRPTSDGVLVPITCLHCSNPVCIDVCPTGAVYRNEDGVVGLRQNRCVGCKLCVLACPMGVPDPDPIRGFVTKCDLCAERASDGLLPACVELCPTGAIEYGEYEDVVKKSKSRSMKLLRDSKLLVKQPVGG